MKSKDYWESKTESEKLEALQLSCGSDKTLQYRPYCLSVPCSKQSRFIEPRLLPRPFGFECSSCGNMIGFDMYRLKESPLNEPEA